jgi:hypothetical protein|tara:strand:- start:363 stop:590 length:228 start_codon:yes stop_codon:yes gene_type:complete
MKSITYYRILHADGEMRQSESLEEVMTYIPKSYKKTDDTSRCNHLTWLFEKLEQTIFEDGSDNTECIEHFYFVSK